MPPRYHLRWPTGPNLADSRLLCIADPRTRYRRVTGRFITGCSRVGWADIRRRARTNPGSLQGDCRP